eukprot:2905194-Rhodomonas_salina.1
MTALSTAEAEYYTASASVCGTDVTYVQWMMEELGYRQRTPLNGVVRGQHGVHLHVAHVSDVPQGTAY